MSKLQNRDTDTKTLNVPQKGYLKAGLQLSFLCLVAAFIFGCSSSQVKPDQSATGKKASQSQKQSYQGPGDTRLKFMVVGIQSDYSALPEKGNIEVMTQDGVVLLLGQVPSKEIKKSYGKKASKLPGVKMVYNELKVGEPAGFGTYVNDSSITSSVKYTLTAHGINPFNISVATQKGVVYLLGDVSEETANKAAKIASKISGVQKVVKVFPEN